MGWPVCVGIAAAEPPGGQVARAGIAEGSVIGATEPIGGASGARGAGIARERWWGTVSYNEAVAGRGTAWGRWSTASCDGAGSDRGVA